MTPINLATVVLWGTNIAVISWDEEQNVCDFQYLPEFIKYGIEVAPITMPLRHEPYRFPNLNFETFRGLPGMLADALPDKFGNAIIKNWLLRQNRSIDNFNSIERLCYTGTRAMGALEFIPTSHSKVGSSNLELSIDELVKVANEVLISKSFEINSEHIGDKEMQSIYLVGTSAGGARAKAIINWNPSTNIIVAGHELPKDGFESWLIKFDGISENKDKEKLADPQGFGRIEYAYYKLALQCGIKMSESRLLEESGRAHFMTKRFDRVGGRKIHKTSLCGMAHQDFNDSAVNSYEGLFYVARQLDLNREELIQLVKQMAFNVIFRNQDDHTKNFEFLMQQTGIWELAPAFDLTFSYNPEGEWTHKHQLSINEKHDDFQLVDLVSAAKVTGLSAQKIRSIIESVSAGTDKWESIAKLCGVTADRAVGIAHHFRVL